MHALLRKGSLACTILLIAAIVLSGCSAHSPSVNLAAQGMAFASPGEKDQMLDYLNAARDDFAVIDALIDDRELGLMEEEDTDEEITAQEVDYYFQLLDEHSTKISNTLAQIKARVMPNHPDIAFFKTAQISQFELTGDVIAEYMQVLHYLRSLQNMSIQLENLENVDATDAQSMYKAFSEGIELAIQNLQTGNVPSFLKSMNDNMIASLKEMNDAVLYTLIAEELDDPVRRNAAAYRLGILERKFTRISLDAEQDMTERQDKLKNDLEQIQEVNSKLRQWVQDNLNLLGGN